MKQVRFILCIAIICSITNYMGAQAPATSANKENLSGYLSLGTGICSEGAVAGLSYGFVSSKGFGGEIEYKICPFKSEELPDDFSDGNFNMIIPRDLLNILSLNITKDFKLSSKRFKIGVDVGPCIVMLSCVNFTLNPDYPGSSFEFKNKYLKDRNSEFAAGLSASAKLKYQLSFGELQAALFTDLNNIKTLYGLELYISFFL